jgi:hypothetical protein
MTSRFQGQVNSPLRQTVHGAVCQKTVVTLAAVRTQSLTKWNIDIHKINRAYMLTNVSEKATINKVRASKSRYADKIWLVSVLLG